MSKTEKDQWLGMHAPHQVKVKTHRVWIMVQRDDLYNLSVDGWQLDPAFPPIEDFKFVGDKEKRLFFYMWRDSEMQDMCCQRDEARQAADAVKKMIERAIMDRWDEWEAAAKLGGKEAVLPLVSQMIEKIQKGWR